MDELEQIYEDNLYPSLNKFWNILQRKHIDISYSVVNSFIDQQPITQIFRVRKHKSGHITAFAPFQRIQIDIAVMDKFGKSNEGYKYILFLIDVFTRKGYAIPMKTKNIQDTSEALESFCENNFVPEVVNCDNDSSFIGREFQKVINKYHILMIPNNVGNHKQLGIVDRFIETMKNHIYKYFKYHNTVKWIDILPKILRYYNATPHSALDGIKPESAHLATNAEAILSNNINEGQENNQNYQHETVFEVGDKVRKKVKITFKNRSFNPTYSTQIFTVNKIKGNRIYLEGLKNPVSAYSLQLIPKDSIETNDEALNDAIKADKVRRVLKKEGIYTDEPIQIVKRNRKQIDYSKLHKFGSINE